MLKINKFENFALMLFVAVPIIGMIANFSLYYAVPYQEILVNAACLLVFCFCGGRLIDANNYKAVTLYACMCLVIVLTSVVFHGERPYAKNIYELVYASIFLLLKKEYRLWCYNKFIKLLAVLLLCGIVEYLITIVVGIVVNLGSVTREVGHYIIHFNHGVFCLIPEYFDYGYAFRFQSISEEPGLIGTLCGFIIPTLNYQRYKKEFYIYMLAGILSFSLAFYVMISIYFAATIFNLKRFVILCIVASISYVLLGDIVDELIIDRISDRSIEDIDNRTNYEFNRAYEQFWNSDKILFGVGNRTAEQMSFMSWGNAGMKVFLFQYGVIPYILLVISFSWMFIHYSGNNYKSWLLLLIIWISFYQRSDWNLSTNIMVLFSWSLIKNHQIIKKATHEHSIYIRS